MVGGKTNTYARLFLIFAALALLAGMPAATLTINMTYPQNASYYNVSHNITFVFMPISSNESSLACVAYLNTTAVGSNLTSANNTLTTIITAPQAANVYNATVNCTGSEFNLSNWATLTVESTAPAITNATVSDADNWYSPVASYNIINMVGNASDSSGIGRMYVLLWNHLNNTSLATANLSYDGTSKVWNGTLNATTYINNLKAGDLLNNSSPVAGLSLAFFAVDNANITSSMNNNTTYGVLLHDLGSYQGPPSNFSTCVQEGSGTTNMSSITNFNNVNYTTIIRVNGSSYCSLLMRSMNETMPWGDTFRLMANFTFFGVNMSSQANAEAVMSAMGNLIRPEIAPPHSFESSRIFVNSTAAAALNKSANVTLYDLPFSSTPNVTSDNGGTTGITSILWAQGAYNSTYQSKLGNLTIEVSGFSGYYVSDYVAPTVAISAPTAYQNNSSHIWLNFTANGTGSEISFVRAQIYNATSGASVLNLTYDYSSDGSDNSSQCSQIAEGSENVSCSRRIDLAAGTYNLSNGTYYANVSVWDFSPAPNASNNTSSAPLGNTGSAVRNFTLENVTPVITLLSPLNNSNLSSGNVTYQFTVSDVASTVNCTFSIDGSANNSSWYSTTGTQTLNVGIQALGRHNYSITCVDGVGLSNVSNTYGYTVDNETLVITMTYPTNNLNTTNTTLLFNWTANDTYATAVFCNLSIDGSVNRSNISISNGTPYTATANPALADGSHNWTVACWDPSNNTNSSAGTRNFTVDATGPTITFNSPTPNSTATSASATLNVTVSDATSSVNNSTCRYQLNSGTLTNITNCTEAVSLTLAAGINSIIVYANDTFNNSANSTIYVIYDSTNNATIINATTNLTGNQTVVVLNTSGNSVVNVPLNSTLATLNLTNVSTNGTTAINATLPGDINVSSNTSMGTVNLSIPSGCVITGNASWNSSLNLPQVLANSSATPTTVSGYTNAVTAVLEVGQGDYSINLSKGARILIPAMAGKHVGWQRGSSFTEITSTCSADSQAVGDALSAGADCKIDSGTALVVWTRHFTKFAAYTQTATSSSSSSSSNTGGGASGGSGSATSSSQAENVVIDIGRANCTVSVERSIESGNNLSVVTVKLSNLGGTDCDLEEFMFSDVIPPEFSGIPDITFSPVYTYREGWKVSFPFPSFAGGESISITYSVPKWVGSSRLKNFTEYELSAKYYGPQPEAPTPPATTTTPNVTTTTPKNNTTEPVIKPTIKPLSTTEPQAAPVAAGGQEQQGGLFSGVALFAFGIVVLLVLVGVGYLLFKRRKKGLEGV
jgi:hypothetical protein